MSTIDTYFRQLTSGTEDILRHDAVTYSHTSHGNDQYTVAAETTLIQWQGMVLAALADTGVVPHEIANRIPPQNVDIYRTMSGAIRLDQFERNIERAMIAATRLNAGLIGTDAWVSGDNVIVLWHIDGDAASDAESDLTQLHDLAHTFRRETTGLGHQIIAATGETEFQKLYRDIADAVRDEMEGNA